MKKKIIFIILLSVCLCLSAPTYSAKAKENPLSDLMCFVVMSASEVVLDIGDSYTLFAVSTDGGKVSYKSSDSKVASVSAYGVVTAKEKGSVTITATRKKAKATCRITVRETTIGLSKKSVVLDCGEMTGITATTSNGKAVKWKSSKPSIARVSEKGLITALKPGSCTVTASVDGSRSVCNVTVAEPQIRLSADEISLFKGGSYRLRVDVSSKRTPTFKSGRKSVATVSADGTITGVKHGSTVITVTVDGVSVSCNVTVESPVITLDKDEITLKKGESTTLKATVSSGQSPAWSTSNSSVIRADKKTGKITAVSKGKAFIYASEDGAKARCRVIVE
ncbi:MAG: Ig-like domain-containing protein [Lachnospiraceae bacterium]|nr:Ig-like domain-containing protein [Lachnospiraceae bacterium]